jgi:casein kinase II subunit beta
MYGNCMREKCGKQRVLPIGTSDKLGVSRLKVYCPWCEEIYLPKYKSPTIDGAFYGTSIAHIFMATYPGAVVLPPKTYYTEPKIFGFHLFGKKGSKYYNPVKGGIRYTEDEENIDGLIENFKQNYKREKELIYSNGVDKK